MKTDRASSGFPQVASGQAGVKASSELNRLWLFAALPFAFAGSFFLSLVLSDGVLLRFAPDAGGTRDALLFLLFTSLTAVSAAIELDVRLMRIAGLEAESARAMLGFSSFLAFVLFLVWVGAAMDRSGAKKADIEFLFCILIVGTCSPLLWSAAKQLELATHRWALLGGFIVATAAMELAFDVSADDEEERFFMYQSTLVALAIAIRLGVWGIKEFRQPV